MAKLKIKNKKYFIFYAKFNNSLRFQIGLFCTGVFFIYILKNYIYQKIWYNISIEVYIII